MKNILDKNLNSFISLAEASKITGYHQDYLGFLCRQGKMKGFKVGRNWLITNNDLNDFLSSYKNGIDEVTDETGHKIKVHVRNIVADEASTEHQANNNELQSNEVAQITKLDSFKKNVVSEIQERIEGLKNSLSKVETELITKQNDQAKLLIHKDLDLINAPASLTNAADNKLSQKFSSNFNLGSNQLDPNSNLGPFLSSKNINELYKSFAKQNSKSLNVVFISVFVALLGVVGSFFLSGLLTSTKLDSLTNQSKIIYSGNSSSVFSENIDRLDSNFINQNLTVESSPRPTETKIINQLLGLSKSEVYLAIDERLNQYLSEGKFKGDKGEPGETGPQGSAGVSSVLNSGQPVSYIQPNPSTGYSGGSISGVTYLSAQNFNAVNSAINNLTVSGGLTLSGITGSVQCLHVDTNGVVSGTGVDCGVGSGGGNGNIATGTAGALAFYESANASISAQSILFVSGSNIGLGTSSPADRLTLVATSSTQNILNITSSTGSSLLVVDWQGNVGIGSSSPGSKLVVVGNSSFGGSLTVTGVSTLATSTISNLTVSGITTLQSATTSINGLTYYWPSALPGSNRILQSDSTGNLTWVADQVGGAGSVSGGATGFVTTWASSTGITYGILRDNGTVAGVNATSSTISFNIQGSTTLDPFNVSSSSGTSLFVVKQSGRVGIGTTTPTELLTVVGNGLFTNGGATSTLYLDVSSRRLGIGTTTPSGQSGITIARSQTDSGYGLSIYTNCPNAGAGCFSDIDLGQTAAFSGISYDRSLSKLNLNVNSNSYQFTLASTGNIGIATGTPPARFTVQNSSTSTGPALIIASSSGASFLTIASNGSTTLSSLGTGLVRSSNGSLYTDTTTYLQSADLANYVQYTYASSTFPSFTYASSTFATVANYPTYTYASSTFVTYPYASSTFQPIGSYLTSIGSGNPGFLSRWNGANTLAQGVLRDNGTVAGINATSSTTSFWIQGSAGNINPLVIASSTGTQLLTITANGNVGIGTDTPAYKLDVNGGSRFASIARFENDVFMSNGSYFIMLDNTGSTNNGLQTTLSGGASNNVDIYFSGYYDLNSLLRITATGNVGIGTSSPASKLQVAGNVELGSKAVASGASLIFNTGSTTNQTQIRLLATSSLSSSYILTLPTTTPSAGQAILTDANGNLYFGTAGASLSGGTNGYLARWTSASTLSTGVILDNGTVAGVNATSSTTSFWIQGSAGSNNPFVVASSTGTQLLTVTPRGFVGIGTSTPLYKLDVVGDSRFTDVVTFNNDVYISNGAYSIFLDNTGSVSEGLQTTLSGGASNNVDIFFSGYYDLDGKVRITSAGSVGIGTSTPQAKLTVQNVATSTGPALIIASSSGTSLLTVGTYGSTTIANLGTGCVGVSSGSLYTTTCGGGSVSGSGVPGKAAIWSAATALTTGILFDNGTVAGVNATSSTISFNIQGSNTLDPFNVSSSTGTSLLRVTSSGNIGIGTTTPTAKLSIQGTSTLDILELFTFGGGEVFNMDYLGQSYIRNNTYIEGSNVSLVVGASSLIKWSNLNTASAGSVEVGIGRNSQGVLEINDGNLGTYRDLIVRNYSANTSSTSTVLTVQGLAGKDVVNISSTTGLSLFRITQNGNVGIGTSSPVTKLSIYGSGTVDPFDVASSSNLSVLRVTSGGKVGIGTTTPGSTLTVVGDFYVTSTNTTSTLAGGLNVNSGAIMHDWSSGVTSIDNLQLGALKFEADSGMISWVDMPVTASSSTSTVMSYTALLDGNDLFTIYGQSNGTGSVMNLGVVVGSTTPTARFSVQNAATSTGAIFDLASSSGASLFRVSALGNVGIGTTSPAQLLSVAGNMRLTGALFDSVNASGTLGMVLQSTGTSTMWVATSTLGITGGSGVSGGTIGYVARFASSTALTTGVLFDNGTVAGVNATSSTISFNIQGTTTLDPFNVSSSSGVSVLRVTANQRVGIGSTTPNATLVVQGTSTYPTVPVFTVASSTGQQLFTVLANGNVGIGTSSPSAKLAVYGDTLLEGSSRYLNFGTVTSSSGYGFRDNAGLMEFKDSTGNWQRISTTTAVAGPSFFVHKNGTSQTVTADVSTLLTWSTETFDTNNNFDLSTERFTPTVAGKYIIHGSLYALADGADYAQIAIKKNGTTVALNEDNAGLNGNVVMPSISMIIDMNGTTDYVELYVISSITSISGDSAQTYFSGAMIAPVQPTGGGWQNDNTQSYLADSADLVGIGTSTPQAKLTVQNVATSTGPALIIASSSGTSLLTVGTYGSTTIANLGTGCVGVSSGSLYTTTCGGGSVSGSGVPGKAAIWSAATALTTGILFDNGTVAGVNATSSTISFNIQGSTTLDPFNVASSTGTSLLRVTSLGNVGIGTTTPQGLLTIQGTTTTSTASLLTVASSTGASLFTILPNGNVGIGTNTPQVLFDMSGSSVPKLYVRSVDNSTNEIRLVKGTDTDSNADWIFRNASSLSLLHSSSSIETNILFVESSTLNVSVGSGAAASSKLFVSGNAAIGSSYVSLTAPTNGLLVQGNVGIGTGTPEQRFVVNDNARIVGAFFDSSNASGTLGMVLQTTGTTTRWVATSTLGLGGGSAITGGGASGLVTRWTSSSDLSTGILYDNGTVAGVNATSSTISFNIQGTTTLDPFNVSSSSGTSMLRVTSGSKVGIGTTTPSALLALQGTASSGDLFKISSSTGNSMVYVSAFGGFVQNISSSTAFVLNDGSSTPAQVFVIDTSQSSNNAGLDITAGGSQTGNLFNMFSSGGSFMAGFSAYGGFMQNISSTSAVSIQNGSGVNVFNINTLDKKVGIGTSTGMSMLDIISDISIAEVGNPSMGSSTATGLRVITSDDDSPSVLIKNTSQVPCIGQATACNSAVAAGGPGILTIEASSSTNATWYNLITAYNSATRNPTSAVFRVRGDGNVYGEAAFNASGADYAEYFDTFDTSIEAGDLVIATTTDPKLLTAALTEAGLSSSSTSTIISSLTTTHSTTTLENVNSTSTKSVLVSAVMKSNIPYDSKIIGIVSSQAAFIGNNPGGRNDSNKFKKAVGLVGRVPLKVTNENGPVKVGDFLTSSAKFPGYAMKATRSGYTVGYALEDFDPSNPNDPSYNANSSGSSGGVVLTFIKPGYSNINNTFVLGENDGQLLNSTSTLTTNNSQPSTSFLIDQKGSGNILQLQTNSQDRLLVGANGSMEILAKVQDGENVLAVSNASATLFSINSVGDAKFTGHIIVSKDTAGTAKIKAGDNQTVVTFETPYSNIPKVVVSVNGLPNFFYGVINKTENGFTISTDRAMTEDMTFDWVALSQPEETNSESRFNLQVVNTPAPIPQPEPQPEQVPRVEPSTGSEPEQSPVGEAVLGETTPQATSETQPEPVIENPPLTQAE